MIEPEMYIIFLGRFGALYKHPDFVASSHWQRYQATKQSVYLCVYLFIYCLL